MGLPVKRRELDPLSLCNLVASKNRRFRSRSGQNGLSAAFLAALSA